MHHQIDYLAYGNRLRYLPPEQKLGFALLLLTLGYLSPVIVQGMIAVWLFFWVVVYGGIPAGIYFKLLSIPWSFWLLSLPALLIDLSWTDHLSISWSYVGWEQAKTILPRAIALSSCLYFILLTIPFADLWRLLRQWGCPSLITDLLVLMYRFIFVLAQTASELLTAQASRFGYCSWSARLRSLGLVVSHLLWRTLENYHQLTLGLTSRGFSGELGFWSPTTYQSQRRYTQEAIGGYLLLLILVGWYYAHGFRPS